MLEARDAVVLAGPRRQHDDRYMRRIGARPEDAADFEAADDWQVQVENDEIRRPIGDRFERRIAGADDARVGVAAAFESVLDQPGDVGFVFDDEDLWLRH